MIPAQRSGCRDVDAGVGHVTPLLRSRLARFAFVAVFVVPLGTSSLRGLTHVLTCGEEIRTPFSIAVPQRGEPTVTTSLRIDQDSSDGVCNGLRLNLGARLTDEGDVELVLPLSNASTSGWHGTVQLRLGNDSLPVDIGAVAPRSTSTDKLPLQLPAGAHELSGTLLIGP